MKSQFVHAVNVKSNTDILIPDKRDGRYNNFYEHYGDFYCELLWSI